MHYWAKDYPVADLPWQASHYYTHYCGFFIGRRVPMSGVCSGPVEIVDGSAITAGSGSGTDIPAGRMKSLLFAIFTSLTCTPGVAWAGRGNSTMYRSRTVIANAFSASPRDFVLLKNTTPPLNSQSA